MKFDVHYTVIETDERKKAEVEATSSNKAAIQVRKDNKGVRIQIRKIKAKKP